MTYEPEQKNDRIKLSTEDRKALQNLAEIVNSGLRQMQSYRKRVGSAALRKIGVIIVQDPDNPDTVQICTDVVSGDGPFEISCWCDPPGICTPGPCSGGMI